MLKDDQHEICLNLLIAQKQEEKHRKTQNSIKREWLNNINSDVM